MHSRVFAWGTVVSRPQNRQILVLFEELALATVPSTEIRSVSTNGTRVRDSHQINGPAHFRAVLFCTPYGPSSPNDTSNEPVLLTR
jgi:hypothetical protein